jgi:hypothetical protein
MLNTIGFMDDVFDRFLVTVVILPQSSLMLPVQRFPTWWKVNNDGDDATEHAFLNIMTNCKAVTRFGCIIDRNRWQESDGVVYLVMVVRERKESSHQILAGNLLPKQQAHHLPMMAAATKHDADSRAGQTATKQLPPNTSKSPKNFHT